MNVMFFAALGCILNGDPVEIATAHFYILDALSATQPPLSDY